MCISSRLEREIRDWMVIEMILMSVTKEVDKVGK